MRKIYLFIAALCCAVTINAASDVLSGKFTVDSEGKQVRFSKGNLQATTTDKGTHWTWAFAKNQWDHIGDATANNAIIGNGQVSSNGKVDIFGWSTTATYYGIHDSSDNNTYSGDFKDWGETMGAEWRTLTKDEWVYLFHGRDHADDLFGFGTVNNVKGVILLPDKWTIPPHLLFLSAKNKELEWNGSRYTNSQEDSYSHNFFVGDDWEAMADSGAVFLPITDGRNYVFNTSESGLYWSSTGSGVFVYYLIFSSALLNPSLSNPKYLGNSVRLVQDVQAPQVYTEFDKSTGVLTYYCDDKIATRPGITETYDPVNNPDAIRFREQDYYLYITKAVIDESMRDTLLTSMQNMFYGGYDEVTSKEYFLQYLTEIEGLENLNTSNVTDMYSMFYGCSSLESLDLSSFNTIHVTDMSAMFYDCASLQSLDLSSFKTDNVKDMSFMFYCCESLQTLDISSFNTTQVTDMGYMFGRCFYLTSLELRSFNTANVTLMNHMFVYCVSLKSINLSSFDVTKVKTMVYMFAECFELTTIYCNADWSASTTLVESENMFRNCEKLVGARGTPYDANHVDKKYAHLDEGKDNPGYFTWEPYDVYTVYDESTKTLTYYCDMQRAERAGDGIVIEFYTPEQGHDQNRFAGYANRIRKVVIDPSFYRAKLESLADMFNGGENLLHSLKEIEGLDNIDFSYVTDMYAMFYECRSLTSVDLSSFNTYHVTNMEFMFRGCSSLKALDLFAFDVKRVQEMTGMFYDCSNLTTIYCKHDWSQSTALKNSDWIFGNCYKLVGEQGSFYNPNYADCKSIVYARPDGGEEHPGYFTTTYPTAIDQITNDQSPITNKVLRDGQLYFIRDKKVFNATGTQVK